MKSGTAFLAAILVATTAYAEANGAQTPPAASSAVSAKQTTVASGLAHPWDMAFLSASEALVTEKDGGLRRVSLTTGEISPIAGFPNDLDNIRRDDPRDNSGMFGIVLDPAYAENGWIYIAYSAGDADGTATRVIRGRLNADDALADVEEVFIATPLSTDRFHYGGGLAFGADGKLYVTIGERFFNERDQPALPVSQDPTDARGKIYRLNPDGSIPEDNPAFGAGATPGLYAMGIRASQGLTLNSASGVIWFSEHGSRQGDEINILRAGANYGWPVRTTGAYRNEDYVPPSLDNRTYTDPVYAWAETTAPTGLTFYTGSDFPMWRGDLFVAGLSRGSLWRLDIEGETVQSAERLFEDAPVRLRNVKQAPDGKLYLLTDEAEGRIIRIDAD